MDREQVGGHAFKSKDAGISALWPPRIISWHNGLWLAESFQAASCSGIICVYVKFHVLCTLPIPLYGLDLERNLFISFRFMGCNQRLHHHQLTVTQMVWSQSGRFLLAVSRDRTWSVWHGSECKCSEDVTYPIELPNYNLIGFPAKGKGHSRIIWTGAWSPDER